MKELKPCPFCGADAYYDALIEPHTHHFATLMPDVEGYTQFIACTKCPCGIYGKECSTAEEAIESAVSRWNTRS